MACNGDADQGLGVLRPQDTRLIRLRMTQQVQERAVRRGRDALQVLGAGRHAWHSLDASWPAGRAPMRRRRIGHVGHLVGLGEHRDAVEQRIQSGRAQLSLVAVGHQHAIDGFGQLRAQFASARALGMVDDELDHHRYGHGQAQRPAVTRTELSHPVAQRRAVGGHVLTDSPSCSSSRAASSARCERRSRSSSGWRFKAKGCAGRTAGMCGREICLIHYIRCMMLVMVWR